VGSIGRPPGCHSWITGTNNYTEISQLGLVIDVVGCFALPSKDGG
jgi:hypothetical protein